jgi:peptidoglycan/xylan/chitin deacetylase (PgdA/CDA1 family)
MRRVWQGRGDPLMAEVLDVLDEFGASATFFVISGQARGKEELLRECAARGHELANHGAEDISYHRHTRAAFAEALNDCEEMIARCGPRPGNAVKWFRPPHGRCSAAMQAELAAQEFRIALCDTWGFDVVADAEFVTNFTLKHAGHGKN